MKTRSAKRHDCILRLCALLILAPAISVSETDSLLIVGFKRPSPIEPELERIFFPKNDGYIFPRELADRLQNSQSVQLYVDLGDTVAVDPDLLKGYGTNKSTGLEKLVSRMKGYRYFLVGRIGMDAQIARVSGEVYAVNPNEHSARLYHSFSSEAPLDERGVVARGSFVEDVAVSVEGKLDKLTRVLIRPFKHDPKDSVCLRLAPQVGELLRTRLALSQGIRVLNASALTGVSYRKLGDRPNDTIRTTIPMSGRKEAAHYVIGGSLFEYGNVVSVEAYHVNAETGQTILAASVLLDSLTGKSFYKNINSLGDDMRRAIDLQTVLRSSTGAGTLAVVALPPYPSTKANRQLALEIAGCIDRKLRLLQGSGINLPSVAMPDLLEQYVVEPQEEVVMGRAFNTEFLCLVHLERPADQIYLSLTMANVRSPLGIRTSIGPKVIPIDTLDRSLNEAVLELLQKLTSPFSVRIDTAMIERMTAIHTYHRPKRIAVNAAPSYLNTTANNDYAARITRNVVTKLKALEGSSFDVDVFFTDGPGGGTDADYLWRVEWFNAENLRSLHMRLSNIDNPYGSIHAVDEAVDHLDHVAAVTDSLTTRILDLAFPQWRYLEPSRIDNMHRIQLSAPYRSIQLGLNLVGITEDSRAVFGNRLRAGLEFKAILTDLFGGPFYLGLAGEFDFGKTRPVSKIRGRYGSIVVRYLHTMGRESRLYGDVCPALLNVEREAENVHGQVNFGVILAVGMQMPVISQLFLDLNGRFIIPFGETELGSAPPELFEAGMITSLSFGIGVGWRFE
jgi:hypothetical protein